MKTLPLSEVKMKLSALVEAVRTTDEEIGGQGWSRGFRSLLLRQKLKTPCALL